MYDIEICVRLESRGARARSSPVVDVTSPPKRTAGRQSGARRLRRYTRLFLEQEGLCFYCRQPMELPHPGNSGPPLPPNRITSEHLFPGDKTKRQRRQCVVAACHACNQERGSSYHWRDFLIRKIEHYWAPR